jgi:hypothetical protein
MSTGGMPDGPGGGRRSSKAGSRRVRALAAVVGCVGALAGVMALPAAAAAADTSIFGTEAPLSAPSPERAAVQLGVVFSSSQAGHVSGIRFYKHAANAGTHRGALWTSGGHKLAGVTFSNETASGWQTARFSTPVAVRAGVSYVATYHTMVGRYATDPGYFENGRRKVSGPLTATGSKYVYGSTPRFPVYSYRGSNYWVDVLFTAAGASPVPSPSPTPEPIPSPVPEPSPVPSGGCDLFASPASFGAQFAAAGAGQTLCLASGDYGTFRGAEKSGVVTIREQEGASASMAVSFSPAARIVLDGLTIRSAYLRGATRDVTIRNSQFTGGFVVDSTSTGANLLLDGNTHVGINASATDSGARVTVWGGGLTVQRSLFRGGDSDGVRVGGPGARILDNEFVDLVYAGGNHTDAIQIYGVDERDTTIRGNYFHGANMRAGVIAGYDGVTRALIEHNVIDVAGPAGRPWAIELGSDNGSIVRHNTLVGGTCEWAMPCGIIYTDAKSGMPASTGTVIVDNVATRVEVRAGSTNIARHHNMVRESPGAGDFLGTPLFTGGARPTSYAGFHLATGSPGKQAASDGTDVGIR